MILSCALDHVINIQIHYTIQQQTADTARDHLKLLDSVGLCGKSFPNGKLD